MSNLLRFPTGKSFARILEDDHEWEVLTDTQLRPIVMVRGDRRNGISNAEIKRAYYQLAQKIPSGKQIRIYDLHSHPGASIASPSYMDIKTFVEERIINPYKVTLVGHGVITKKEILIVKLHGTTEELKRLYWGGSGAFQQDNPKLLSDDYRQRTLLKMVDANKNKRGGIEANSSIKVLKEMANENPEIKIKRVPKLHRFTMAKKRWRR